MNTAQQAGSSETARNLLAVVYTSLAITAFSIVGLAGGSGGSGGGSAEEQGSSFLFGLLAYAPFAFVEARYREAGSSAAGTT